MTAGFVWIVVVALALACAVLVWVLRKRRGDSAPGDAPAPEPEPEVASVLEPAPRATATIEAPHVAAPVSAPPPPPPPPPVSDPPAASVAGHVAGPDPSATTQAPRPRPPAPVLERVVAMDVATIPDWQAATVLALSPLQAAAVAAAVAPLLNALPDAVHAVDFGPGAAIRIARGEASLIQSLAARHASTVAGPARWLDSTAATTLAASALAVLANERFLDALGDEARELKAAVAALPARLAADDDAKARSLVQDFSRFAREARENYAAVIGKLAYRERVADANERALATWRRLVAVADASRQSLAAIAAAARFGEVQVEKSMAQWRGLRELERLLEVAARCLAALHRLRLAIGEPASRAAIEPLESAAAALRSALAQDGELIDGFVEREKGAKGDAYVGKGEFEANRAVLRKLLEARANEPMARARESVEVAIAAGSIDPGDATLGVRLLIRLDTLTGSCEMRRATSA